MATRPNEEPKGCRPNQSRGPGRGIDLVEFRSIHHCIRNGIKSIESYIQVSASREKRLVTDIVRVGDGRALRETGGAYQRRDSGGRIYGVEVVAPIGFINRSIELAGGKGRGG
jgi:hypothetical protein